MVFTDGSVCDGSVGCGACAAVLVPISGEEDKYQDSKAVGQKVTSVTCELEGIALGLELSVNYFRFCKYRQQRESVFIFCDCTVVIDRYKEVSYCTITVLENTNTSRGFTFRNDG